MDVRSKENRFAGYKAIIGVVIIKIFNRSVTTVFGLLFEAFFWRLKSSQVEISFIMTSTLVISNFAGIFSGYLTQHVSTRTFAIIGTLCISCGLIVTSFVTSYAIVIVTYSLVVGIGIGLVTLSTFLGIVESFTERRTQAIAISSTGGVIGDILMPQIVGFLLMNVQCETTILITGVISLLGTLGAFLLLKEKKKEEKIATEETPLIIKKKPQTMFESIVKAMDLNLLKDKSFLIRIFGISFGFVVCADFDLIFPFFLKV